MTENMMIELNETGVVAVHGNIDDASFLTLISPAIVHLDETIRDLQSFVRSKAFGQVVQDAAQKLGNIAETEAHFAAASTATSESTVTRVVDYGEQKHGVPPESEKYSFKMKVRAMSADELAQRCADDPEFKAALDALE